MGEVETIVRRQGKKLYQIVYALRDFGVGRKVTRTIWRKSPDGCVTSYWTITKVKPYRDLRRIRAWGVLTWQGVPSNHETKIRRILKKQWILLGKDFNIEHDIPSYPDKRKALLLYPSPDAPSLESLVSRKRAECIESPTDSPAAKKRCLQGTLCDRLVVIDSTWSQAKQISADERLRDIQQVQLQQVETLFWRPQRKPSHYLATVEAIYYFFKQLYELQEERHYEGQYDNLLYLFAFQYLLIRRNDRTE